MSPKTLFCIFLLSSLCCFGQGVPSIANKPPERLPTDPPTTVIRIDDGSFTLEIPADLTMENPAIANHSYRPNPAFNAPQNAAEVGKDPCSHTLAMFGKGGEVDSDSSKATKKFAPIPPAGGLAVVEVDDRCIVKMTDESVLGRLAHEAQQVPGLKPMAQMISYSLEDHPVWLAMSGGPSMNEKGERTPEVGLTLVGHVSLKSNGHFFVVGFVANNTDLFNRMLKCRIQFKDKRSGLLVPFELSSDPHKTDAVPR